MSDISITPEAIGYRPSLVTTPFYPSIQSTVEGEGESATIVYKVKFNQGYVYDHSNAVISTPITISSMESYELIEINKKYIFYIELVVNANNNAVSASLKNLSAAADAASPSLPDNTSTLKHFEVCKMQGLSFTSFKLRENIHWSGSGGGAFIHPWKATENGNEFITIAAGEVLRLNSSAIFPLWWTPLSYAGGSIEVTGNGYIVISMATTDLNGGGTNYGDSGLIATPTSISVVFSSDIDNAGGNMNYPICQVSLTAGVATVTKQLLTHNPHLSVTYISAAP